MQIQISNVQAEKNIIDENVVKHNINLQITNKKLDIDNLMKNIPLIEKDIQDKQIELGQLKENIEDSYKMLVKFFKNILFKKTKENN